MTDCTLTPGSSYGTCKCKDCKIADLTERLADAQASSRDYYSSSLILIDALRTRVKALRCALDGDIDSEGYAAEEAAASRARIAAR